MHDRELRLDLIRATDSKERHNKYVLTDAHNPLGKLQEQQSLHHWSSAYLCSFNLDLADQRLVHSNETDLAGRVLGNLLSVLPRVIYFVCYIALVFSVSGILSVWDECRALALFIDASIDTLLSRNWTQRGCSPSSCQTTSEYRHLFLLHQAALLPLQDLLGRGKPHLYVLPLALRQV